jgi:uncharacterized protein with HEPN domain
MAKEQRSRRERLSDIVEWGTRMQAYLVGVDERSFANDTKTQDAVIRCLECIGEASRHIVASDEGVDAHTAELMAAYWTRNRLAHGYFDVNITRVWQTATGPAAELTASVRRLLGGSGS